MCGRITLFHQQFIKQMQTLHIQTPPEEQFIPTYNKGPKSIHWMIYKDQNQLTLIQAQWGITPSWIKDNQVLFNAKIETLLEKPTFSKAFQFHRCVIPVDGFYEWTQEGSSKQPYWFHRMNQEVFFLAGIYFVFQKTFQFVIVTTQANPLMKPFHHRMPVILTKDQIGGWLSKNAVIDRSPFMHIQAQLQEKKVSKAVNTIQKNNPTLIQ